MYVIVRCRVPDLLRAKGWTQRDLAIRANKSDQEISDFCRLRKVMMIPTAKLIASILGCTIDDLYVFKYVGD